MASNADFDKVIEDHVISVIRANTGFNTDHFYGTFSPEQLLHYIKGKLNAVNGTCFVRVSRSDATPVDTIGTAYHVEFNAQVIVGYKPTRSKQLPDTDRETDDMKKTVRNLMIQNPVSIGGDMYRMYWASEDSLVYTTDIDAQLVEFEVGSVYIEF